MRLVIIVIVILASVNPGICEKFEINLLKRYDGVIDYKIFDLDQDGRNEIVILRKHTKSRFGEDRTNSILVMDDDLKRILWQYNIYKSTENIYNLFDPERKEWSVLWFEQSVEDSFFLQIASRDGEIRKTFFIFEGKDTNKSGKFQGSVIIAGNYDVNHDGVLDILIIPHATYDLYPRGIWVLNPVTGEFLWKFGCGSVINSWFFGDLNDDGTEKILAFTSAPDNGSVINGMSDSFSYLILLDINGNLLWKRTMGLSFSGGYMYIQDLDLDGKKEIIVATHHYWADDPEHDSVSSWEVGENKQSLRLKKVFTLPAGYKLETTRLCDFNKDGIKDILLIGDKNEHFILDYNLNKLFHSGKRFNGFSTTSVVDVNNDHFPEILMVDDKTGGSYLYSPDLSEIVGEFEGVRWLSYVNPSDNGCLCAVYKHRKRELWTGNITPIPPGFIPGFTGLGLITSGILLVTALLLVLLRKRKQRDIIEFAEVAEKTSVSNPWLLIDYKGAILKHNSAFTTMIEGLNLPDGKNIYELFGDYDTNFNTVLKNFLEAELMVHSEVIQFTGRSKNYSFQTFFIMVGNRRKRILIVFLDLSTALQVDKLLAWGELAQAIAHEIKTPLSSFKLTLQQIQRKRIDDSGISKYLNDNISSMLEDVERIRSVSQKFTRFSELTSCNKSPCDINEVIEDRLDNYKRFVKKEITFRHLTDIEKIFLPVDRFQFAMLLDCLIDNSVQAIKETGSIEVYSGVEEHVSKKDREIIKKAVIEVLDTGCGIPEEEVENILKPWYHLQQSGSGLGLTIAKRIIELHNGQFSINTRVGKGTVFRMEFPMDE